ncbi:hypothetical protein [Algicola sagamiensis]|uniref:hypothetical protein n=1 Tax=Algicola sagamiensis TaxID=163869 RepID=UPI0003673A92|nr:hypothetical protein [Algicola sagamiensis]
MDFFVGINICPLGLTLAKGIHQEQSWEFIDTRSVDFEGDHGWFIALKDTVSKLSERCGCCIVLPNNMYQIQAIEKPNVPESELLHALPWSLKELVNMNAEEMILDYYDPAFQVPNQPEKINVVVTHRQVISKIVELFRKAKPKLIGISIEDLVMRNMLPIQEEPILQVVQSMNKEPALHIIKNGQSFFSRRLRGFNQIHEYTEDELGEGVADTLSVEIQRSIDYFEGQIKQGTISSIQLSMPTPALTFLVNRVNNNFGAAVSELQWSHGDLPEDLTPLWNYFPAFCGAVEGQLLIEEGMYD